VAFQSLASNLVSGDNNDVADIFVRDRIAGTTERMSVDSSGTQATGGGSFTPSISADGRYVAYVSDASNLVSGDTNNKRDVFVHDRQTGETQLVSVGRSGAAANGDSSWPSISGDGRFVAFSSEASNLVAGDTDGADDVFVRDRTAGTTEGVSTGGFNGNSYAPSISAEGTTTIRYFATDNAGNGESPKTLTVKIDKTPPKVNIVYPANGANNVGRGTSPLAWFSEKVAPASVTTTTFKLYQCSSTRDVNCTTQVTSGTTVTPSTDSASLDPYGTSSSVLAKGTKYKAVVTTGVTDEAGHALDQDPSVAGNQEMVWYFTPGSK
jgi:hypothetical protein